MRLQLTLPFATIALPPPALAGCIRAYILKDTTGRPAPLGGQLNRYPASVYCGVAWLLQGGSERVDPAGGASQPLASTLLLGPQSRPLVTRNPGPVRSFGVVFQPHAFDQITGLDVGALVDGVLPAEDVLPPHWTGLCTQVRQAESDAERMSLVESAVAGWWRPHAVGVVGSEDPAGRWRGALQAHAMAAGLGSSLRNLERHARTWAGQPMRRLAWLSRAESTLLQARVASEHSGAQPRWQDVAADAGYADQAHLCRETQRVTGLSPRELVQRVDGDESYWFYRLWS
jgi:AraC-like DNA-binding protein